MQRVLAILAPALLVGGVLVVLLATGAGPFGDEDDDQPPVRTRPPAVDRFDSAAAYLLLREQVELGPRPAGSAASRRLAARLRGMLPDGRFQAVPGGLRNVIGRVEGQGSGFVVLAAHYDTKDIPGFVGANDGASGTAVVTQLARTIEPRTLRPSVVFALFDGEESPRDTPAQRFEQEGLRGSKVAARRFRDAEAMILLDFVGDADLSIPREGYSNEELWGRLRTAAGQAGTTAAFPPEVSGSILDDHIPFVREGVPSIDLIDFEFSCFHRVCDDLTAVSEESLDVTGETVLRLLASL
ncbi:MAG TPA: M28 family metallopeptidase [Thermoleophilaceae bacterium]|nr:M28 family metallopeptidase [Thermoleophilaceae bacterium]